jgi:hypothetical protein
MVVNCVGSLPYDPLSTASEKSLDEGVDGEPNACGPSCRSSHDSSPCATRSIII